MVTLRSFASLRMTCGWGEERGETSLKACHYKGEEIIGIWLYFN